MKPSTSATPTPPTHSAFPPLSTASAARSSRIAPHSHIKALGLTPEGFATADGAGFIGQNNAREVRVPTQSIYLIPPLLSHRQLSSGMRGGRRTRKIPQVLRPCA